MYTAAELEEILRIRLSKKRFTHSMNVAGEAKKLAELYGYSDPSKAYITGMLHDICKEIPPAEQLEMTKKSRRDVCEVELCTPPLYHAVAGAWYTEHVLGFTDEDMLNAIRYHTIAHRNMSLLEEIIYLADLISADRSYKDVAKMRRVAYQSLDEAMLEALSFSIADVVGKGSMLPHHTIDAYNQLIKDKEK